MEGSAETESEEEGRRFEWAQGTDLEEAEGRTGCSLAEPYRARFERAVEVGNQGRPVREGADSSVSLEVVGTLDNVSYCSGRG